MEFGTNNVKDKATTSKYITYGNQKLKINSMEVNYAKTGSPRVTFNMEGDTVTEKGWEGIEGATGKVGRVRTFYMSKPEHIETFNEFISLIATKLGVKDKVKAIGQVEDIEKFVSAVAPIITGKFAYFAVTAEEYDNSAKKGAGAVGINLHFRKYGAVASVEEGENHLKPYDKSNQWDYKKFTPVTADAEASTTEDTGY